MKIPLPLTPLRQWLGLPPRRFASRADTHWVAMSDGTRLTTTAVRPADGSARPAVLIRTHLPTRGRAQPAILFAHLLAQRGLAVVVQECRGRYDSEGSFTPFAAEGDDGRDSIAWTAEQPWCDGRLVLLGSGYAGFCAWAALAHSPRPVAAFAVAFAARDPHALLYPGGALALDVALRWGLTLGERTLVPERGLDLGRAADFRPLREADRVALRQVDWFREWLDHPARDDYWEARVPGIPEEPPPTLLFGGWNDPTLDPLIGDWRAVDAACAVRSLPRPELAIGPWPERRARGRRGPLGSWMRHALAFLERRLGDAGEPAARVRVFVSGANRWLEGGDWPPMAVGERVFHLRSGGRANGATGDGVLAEEPPENAETPDHFSYDPAEPVPTCGSRRAGRAGRGRSRHSLAGRLDVLCYTSAPLEGDLEVCGNVRAVLFAGSSAPDTDFTAELVDVGPDGSAVDLCHGVLRCRARDAQERRAWLEPGSPTRLEVELGSASHRVVSGHRLRLEVSSSSFPRFDRHPNAQVEPARAESSDCALARQSVFHDDRHPSRLIVDAAEPSGHGARRVDGGQPAADGAK